MHNYQEALDVAIRAAQAAGGLLREEFHRPGGPRGSGDHAEIDEVAERLIREQLLAAFPWSYLGEETGSHDGSDPCHRWLVDPNDGTSAYLQGRRGSAVSVALLRDRVPVLGVVYAFGYPDDAGDLIAWAEGCGPITRQGQPILTDLAGGRLERGTLVFVSHKADENAAANTACVAPARYIAMASIAYRLARVAVGDGVAAVSLSQPSAWDYGAGHALLRAAGGVLVDERGTAVSYTADGQSATRWCFGGAPAAVQDLCSRDWPQVFTPPSASAEPLALLRPVPGRAVADSSMLARAQGSLLGQLAGDSLGGLVEFTSLTSIQQQYPDGVRELHDGGHWGLLAGQPTDDSELALLLARTLVQEGTYDPGAVLEAYVRWCHDPGTFDIGGTIGPALRAAARGQTRSERLRLIEEHGARDRQSDGSLMRISPLGIFAAGQPEQAGTWARQESRLTHPNSVCQDACAAFVAGIAAGIARGGGPQTCYAAALAEAARPGFQPRVRETLERARYEPPADYQTNLTWVLIALQNAFYQLLHASTLEQGVVNTIMCGGDTDTNAAIVGALLGAAHGREAIPRRWLHALLSCRPLAGTATRHPRAACYWPVDALELAEAVLCAK
jgi:ADP-ribosylglycohydrolase/fructose-1,6-bisphosphatase/inositol monophosphatase family enzyme